MPGRFLGSLSFLDDTSGSGLVVSPCAGFCLGQSYVELRVASPALWSSRHRTPVGELAPVGATRPGTTWTPGLQASTGAATL